MKSTLEKYLHFQKRIKAVFQSSGFPEIANEEKPIFDAILENMDEPLQVGALISNPTFGSRSTVHKFMKQLVKKGYIAQVTSDVDGRNKYLVPTPLAINCVSRLGRHIV